jgi:hypothetical protein
MGYPAVHRAGAAALQLFPKFVSRDLFATEPVANFSCFESLGVSCCPIRRLCFLDPLDLFVRKVQALPLPNHCVGRKVPGSFTIPDFIRSCGATHPPQPLCLCLCRDRHDRQENCCASHPLHHLPLHFKDICHISRDIRHIPTGICHIINRYFGRSPHRRLPKL